MTTLVVGATGATGRLLVQQLLDRGEHVKVIVRSADKLPEAVRNHSHLSIIHASVLDLDDATLAEHVRGCEAVASCLGHNLNFRGLFLPPRKLVTDATRRLCHAIKANHPNQPVKFVLMNTVGTRNRDLAEPIKLGEKVVTALLRLLLPPYTDNIQSADYLRASIGQNHPVIQWVAVPPDTLLNHETVSEYTQHPSPTRSAIFNAGKTSRINVAHFMASLITERDLWNKWKGQMPVIYNNGDFSNSA